MRIMLEPEEYEFLMKLLERPLRKPEEMPRLQALLAKESPFAKESDVRSDV